MKNHYPEFVLDSTSKTLQKKEYNGLIDPNLSSFFSSPHRRKLLRLQKLVSITQINQQGLINERMCHRKITTSVMNVSDVRGISVSPISSKNRDKHNKTKTTDTTSINEKLPKIKPISSNQFKDLLHKRRDQVNLLSLINK